MRLSTKYQFIFGILLAAAPAFSDELSTPNLSQDTAIDSTPNLSQTSTVCSLPQISDSNPLSMFFRSDYRNVTCPQIISGITPLPVPLDGLNAKMEMLLGQRIDPALLAEQDPYMELDFSKAPHLDSILISYLVFRADFSGTLLSRALAWHAQHGAHVQLETSDVISTKKDKRLFKKLAAENPNFEVKLYHYKGKGVQIVNGFVDGLHRVMHAKIFLTHSSVDPNANAVIIGGRNVHDAFYFTEPKARKPEWKDVVNYMPGGDEGFIHWHDFEIKIQASNLVDSVAKQFQAMWARNPKSGVMTQPFTSIIGNDLYDAHLYETTSDQALVRHYLSVPFSDNRALEKLYVELIDSAKETMMFSTPYFNLTNPIRDAIARAVDRGVKIKLVTRLKLNGDTADFILSDVNKRSVNRFENEIEIYEYLVPKAILHAKFILIDGKVSMIGGINLNRRSFIHDVENGVLIASPTFTQSMQTLFDSYLLDSQRVTGKQKIAFWKKILIGVLQDEF